MVILICIIVTVIICAYFVIRDHIKSLNNRTYVYPKTGHKYLLAYNGKLKCPSTGEWFDAIIYYGMDDKQYYTREKEDFFNKFVKLNDFKNI